MDWQRALQDPSLMRLGDWLTKQVSENKLDQLEKEGVSKRVMEEKFLREKGKTKTIIMVKDPNKETQPFIKLWTSNAGGQIKNQKKDQVNNGIKMVQFNVQ